MLKYQYLTWGNTSIWETIVNLRPDSHIIKLSVGYREASGSLNVLSFELRFISSLERKARKVSL